MKVDTLLEKDFLPDSITRFGIKALLRKRLRQEKDTDQFALIEELRKSPIAINTTDANQQHYEVPPAFFKIVLGSHLKYSSGYWFNSSASLNKAEEDMLAITVERADLIDGQTILDLGCGWGSFSLYTAKKFSNSKITAVSNSKTQKQFIDQRAEELNLTNLTVITADINDFTPKSKFDRIVSIEMFEHVRNYDVLFKRIHQWLNPKGKLFVHIFTHKNYAYKFEVESDTDWMAKYFFSGGIMPSRDLLLNFSKDFQLIKQWNINGNHYSKTLEAWLTRMDDNKEEIMKIFEECYGSESKKFWSYWRIFFMACSETFAFKNGEEWGVSHYLFEKN
jgi:cyclopropane-fatty-acyl-phospholipid synthase